jgi:hypothetical protein
VPLPGPDGKDNPWWSSARDAAKEAQKFWVRIWSNMNLGAYEFATSPKKKAEPKFPPETFQELVKIAFKDGRLIDSLDHPVVKQLLGLD